ncbi:MAG: succinate dehydrogenase/fumarate reductase iron-sulfur subunit [Proteobacteria bacterium]|nr:succinate dehydrogenase/fumarate reductase iron-sulfur subunit [Desulfobulbaceae bacterium]MBU4152705.1 succinate dehydrogenase/fumarate reductase iron-sulfur subunit [Pseudomonadota bacterium]
MKSISLTLKIWRQAGADAPGAFQTLETGQLSTDMSFLEMLDVINERLITTNQAPVAFDHDCREGICGMCGSVVNGEPHGPEKRTTLCQLHLRHFTDGSTLVIEPFRARSFPVIKDLIVNRSAFDNIIAEGGYVSVNTGSAPDANATPVSTSRAEQALDAAECIGCGACVAACPNAAAMLFVGAKISHLALLPQGDPERNRRVIAMVRKMDQLGFGNCSNERRCEDVCPKGVAISNIARMNREFLRAITLTDKG